MTVLHCCPKTLAVTARFVIVQFYSTAACCQTEGPVPRKRGGALLRLESSLQYCLDIPDCCLSSAVLWPSKAKALAVGLFCSFFAVAPVEGGGIKAKI